MVEQAPASAPGQTSSADHVIRKTRVGTVVSDHNEKTIVVAVERTARHRLYRKVIRRTKRYHAHDEANAATVGDLVRIEECRPFSRLKRWRLVDILTEREVAEVAPEELDEELVDEMQRSAARAAAADAEDGDPEMPAGVEAGEAAEETGEAPAAAAAEENAAPAPEAGDDESDEEKAP